MKLLVSSAFNPQNADTRRRRCVRYTVKGSQSYFHECQLHGFGCLFECDHWLPGCMRCDGFCTCIQAGVYIVFLPKKSIRSENILS